MEPLLLFWILAAFTSAIEMKPMKPFYEHPVPLLLLQIMLLLTLMSQVSQGLLQTIFREGRSYVIAKKVSGHIGAQYLSPSGALCN